MAHDATIQKALQDAREGRLDAALSAVRLLVKRQPKDPDALQVLGLLLTQAGEHLLAAQATAPGAAVADTAGARHYPFRQRNSRPYGRSRRRVAARRPTL